MDGSEMKEVGGGGGGGGIAALAAAGGPRIVVIDPEASAAGGGSRQRNGGGRRNNPTTSRSEGQAHTSRVANEDNDRPQSASAELVAQSTLVYPPQRDELDNLMDGGAKGGARTSRSVRFS